MLTLRDFDDCLFLPLLNLSLARRVQRIRVVSHGYKLLERDMSEFYIDQEAFEPDIPAAFAQLAHRCRSLQS